MKKKQKKSAPKNGRVVVIDRGYNLRFGSKDQRKAWLSGDWTVHWATDWSTWPAAEKQGNAFLDPEYARRLASLKALGECLAEVSPGAHVEGEPVTDTAARVLRGYARLVRKMRGFVHKDNVQR